MKRRSFLAGVLGLPALALFSAKAVKPARIVTVPMALGAPFTTTLVQTQYDAYARAAGAAMGKQIDDIILGVL